MTKIHYIATKEKAIQQLQDYLRQQSASLIAFEPEYLKQVDYLLILEPVKVKEEYFALSRVWKRRLMFDYGHIKLLVAGYAESDHSNFLNLLSLPNDFVAWLSQTHAIAQFPLQYAGGKSYAKGGNKHDQFIDPWDRKLPRRGIDMIKQLRKFLDGHDKHNSVSNQLTRLKVSFINLEVCEGAEREKQLKDIFREWDYLYSRWLYYGPLFEELPFFRAHKRMEQILTKELNDSINLLKAQETPEVIKDVKHQIDELKQLIKTEIEDYVDIENRW